MRVSKPRQTVIFCACSKTRNTGDLEAWIISVLGFSVVDSPSIQDAIFKGIGGCKSQQRPLSWIHSSKENMLERKQLIHKLRMYLD